MNYIEHEVIIIGNTKQNMSNITYSKSNYGRHVMMLISVGIASDEAKCEPLPTRMLTF
jgi:hypothetical protein